MTSSSWSAGAAPSLDAEDGDAKPPPAPAPAAVQFHSSAPPAAPPAARKRRARNYSAAPLPDPRPEAPIHYHDAVLSFARGAACVRELEHAAWLGKRLVSFAPGGQTLHALAAALPAASTADPGRVAAALGVLGRVDEIHAQGQQGAAYAKAVQDLAAKIRLTPPRPGPPSQPQGTSVVEPDAQTPIKALDVMVSYRRLQTPEMEVVTRILKDRGLTYWVDVSAENGILKGVQWGKAIAAAIKGASTMLVLLTPDWIQSQYCIDEFEYACAQHKRVVIIELAPVPPLPDDLDDDATESQRGFLRRQKMCLEAVNSWQKIPFPALHKQSPEALPKLSADPAFVRACDDMEAAIRFDAEAARLHTQLTLRADKYKEGAPAPAPAPSVSKAPSEPRPPAALGFDAGTKWMDEKGVQLNDVPKENRTKAEAVLLHGFALEEAFEWLRKADPEAAKKANYTASSSSPSTAPVADMFHIPTSLSRLWPSRPGSSRDAGVPAHLGKRQAAAGAGAPFLKPTPEQALKQEVQKRRTTAIVVATIAAVLLAALIVSIIFAISAAQQKTEAEKQTMEAEKQRIEAEKQKTEAETQSRRATEESRRATEESRRATEEAQRAKEQEALAILNAARALNASLLADQRRDEALANLVRAMTAEAEAKSQSAIAKSNELLAISSQNDTAKALVTAQVAQNETAKALVAAQVAQNATAKALVAAQAALAEAEDRQTISAALSSGGSDPESALLFAIEALASAGSGTNAALTTAAESTLRSVLESSASGYLWTGGSTPASARRRSLLEVGSATIADFATKSSFYDFQTFTATSPRGTLTLLAGIGIVAPTNLFVDVPTSPIHTFQMHLLGHVFDDANNLVYTIRDVLAGSANKTSFWAFSLGAVRFFIDDYGDVLVRVQKLPK
eukprot:tig00000955_g5807.t1